MYSIHISTENKSSSVSMYPIYIESMPVFVDNSDVEIKLL
jgi:FlaG/FlaF family flagellin (archaellin)